MAEFKQLEAQVQKCEELKEKLQAADMAEQLVLYVELTGLVDEIAPRVTKYRKKAAEKDPEKQDYGPKMLARIGDVCTKYDDLDEHIEEILKPSFEHAAAERRHQYAKAAQRAEEQKQEQSAANERAQREEVLARDQERQAQLAAKVAAEQAAERQRALEQEQQEAARKLEQERLLALEQVEEEQIKREGWEQTCLRSLDQMLDGSVSAFRETLAALENLVGNLAAHPEDAMLKTIRVRNAKFQETVASRPGALLFLRGTGFRGKGREEVDPRCLQRMEAVQPDERFLVLEEPPVSDTLAWHEWKARLEVLARFLDQAEQQLRKDVSARSLPRQEQQTTPCRQVFDQPQCRRIWAGTVLA